MTTTPRWSVTQEMEKAHQTLVFSGGACNILDAEGKLLRNQERDSINDWLTAQGIRFFDPQIHPDTHGVEYDYILHYPLELAARQASQIDLYEVSPLSFGGITSLEIAADHFRWQEPIVIYFSDGDPAFDRIPAHSRKGHPLFTPQGIKKNERAMRAHYQELIKNANNMRKYLVHFAREIDTMTVAFSDRPARGDIVITPERIHASDMFEAVVKAASNERVYVTFSGGERAQDDRGNPMLVAPKEPREIEMRALLDQYVDEGNELRRRIAELVEISVFTRVVYTQKSTILALEELLRIKRIID